MNPEEWQGSGRGIRDRLECFHAWRGVPRNQTLPLSFRNLFNTMRNAHLPAYSIHGEAAALIRQ